MSEAAWYFGSRQDFLAETSTAIANKLAGRAATEGLGIMAEQAKEWDRSVGILQKSMQRAAVLRAALSTAAGETVQSVILEYDFRRRGLRIDCVLLANGIIFVVEFKRSKANASAREQAMTYAINLLEFHEETQRCCSDNGVIVVPVVVQTDGALHRKPEWPGMRKGRWGSVLDRPVVCDRTTFADVLRLAAANVKGHSCPELKKWLTSAFRPSSSILDAAVSLYGAHDVSAIRDHASSMESIQQCVEEIEGMIEDALARKQRMVVFLSGAPGAGKTLVGLDLTLRRKHAAQTSFVTGNLPLVKVLNAALARSYAKNRAAMASCAQGGYTTRDARILAEAATFKIVSAHGFLGTRGSAHQQKDGSVLVFDEAQRTYRKGKVVGDTPLEENEAELILAAQQESYAGEGMVVLALIGQNQAINRDELGIGAWFTAADKLGWHFAVADKTLDNAELGDEARWRNHVNRRKMQHGHLAHSLRFYRNAVLETWADLCLKGDVTKARNTASEKMKEHPVLLTRSLTDARAWIRSEVTLGERAGLIASGQGRRLAAEGMFVDQKPDIVNWMLAPSDDIRASSSLETVQNQYQIQGLELDYSLVCWDLDLRREDREWKAWKLHGAKWIKDNELEIAKNGYRVLLTRARKGMIVFVPRGDLDGRDMTREPSDYDAIAEYLLECGARALPSNNAD